jgi:cytoplasmic iron level regulating protein YaaA (DUF328/UPF0246 family)
VLVLLPPSKTKVAVRRGKPLALERLSFPSLNPMREAVLDALIGVSGRPDATRRLGEAPGLAEVVARNVDLRTAPTAEAQAVYSGVVYDGLAIADLDAAARRRARAWVVVISALWGAVRLGDRIPAYRLDMCGRLPGLPLPRVWQEPLASVLPDTAGRKLIVDCRSAEFVTAWPPRGELAARTVVVKPLRPDGSGRGAASYGAKRTRGLVANRIAADGIDPRRPSALAEALAAHFDVELVPPDRPGRPFVLHVVEPPN